METLNELRDKIYKNALAKGFYRDYLDILSYIDKAHKGEGKSIKELGDIQWSIALASKLLGYDLGDVGKINLDKLRDRACRGVIDGNGDNR
ncbi:MAG: hypothetical protein J6J71_03230 [Prevotella sp.]|nr:hypothetical protein [Alistipes sp.]MBP3573604.1 hypothetical protein [Prevotella sp.]